MEAIIFGDFEWVLAQEIASRVGGSVAPYAGSTDATLSGESVTVVATGGTVHDVAISEPMVSIDVRAESESRAVELGALTQAHVLAIGREGVARDGVVIVGAEGAGGVPYLNPDPLHPTLHRVTMLMTLIIKGHAV